jgi:hypothetical protein
MDVFMDKRMPPCQAAFNLRQVDARWHNEVFLDMNLLAHNKQEVTFRSKTDTDLS